MNGIPPDSSCAFSRATTASRPAPISPRPTAERPVTEEVRRVERDHVPALLDHAIGPAGEVGHHGQPPADEDRQRVGPEHGLELGHRLVDAAVGQEAADRVAQAHERRLRVQLRAPAEARGRPRASCSRVPCAACRAGRASGPACRPAPGRAGRARCSARTPRAAARCRRSRGTSTAPPASRTPARSRGPARSPARSTPSPAPGRPAFPARSSTALRDRPRVPRRSTAGCGRVPVPAASSTRSRAAIAAAISSSSSEHVGQLAIVALAPEVTAVRGADTSWAVTRTRAPCAAHAAFEDVPTSSRAPASRTSSPIRPTANADVRAMTLSPGIRVSALMISSASPSQR